MRLLVLCLSAPFIAFSRVLEILNVCNIRADVESCTEAIDSIAIEAPSIFIDTLIVAEDHRSYLHAGVDPIGIARAMRSYLRRRRASQGASTIEQQLVRVITRRYERTLERKAWEQMLAIAVSRRRSKRRIASAYLGVAFYGSDCIGIEGLRKRCGRNLADCNEYMVRAMIARLKYPEPLRPSLEWLHRHRRRMEYIARRQNASKNTIQPQASVSRCLRRKRHATEAFG